MAKYKRLLLCCSEEKADTEMFIKSYSDFMHALMCFQAHKEIISLQKYILDQLYFMETPFSKAAESLDYNEIPGYLIKSVENDLRLLQKAATLTAHDLKTFILNAAGTHPYAVELIRNLTEWQIERDLTISDDISWGRYSKVLADFHRKNGSGLLARFKGFVWERYGAKGSLKGILNPDPVMFDDFIGYEKQRSLLVDNTLQFLKGYSANNVLLYGDRGTGKSSAVKALLNEFHDLGLRMIEMPKGLLTDIPEVLRFVHQRPQRFILFIDDLAFEDNEEHYTALKAVLEGGLEVRPRNLIIYATTNRRHLIKERFSDRKGLLSEQPNDEIHAADTIQEKLSLADRFGITITFEAPNQEDYLKIVESLALKRGLKILTHQLRQEAVKWEMRYNGRSPRTAQQFICYLEGKELNF